VKNNLNKTTTIAPIVLPKMLARISLAIIW